MASHNPNARLEAFSDGVFAIALTLLIIEIRLPAGELQTTREVWLALWDMLPSVFAFLLSFAIIFITWVNHHELLKRIEGSSPAFIYANGFLLLTVVFVPFPTALLGETLLTDHAAPAVVLYSATDAAQSIGWWLLSYTASHPVSLTRDEKDRAGVAEIRLVSCFGFALYGSCAVAALWWPRAIAALITVLWTAWLFYGIRRRED